MLPRLTLPGLFITGTDTGVGKTIVAAAVAEHFARRGVRVGVFKPVASGCERDSGGAIVCEDAVMLSAVVGGRWSPQEIAPMQFVERVTPAVAARIEGRPVDWNRIRDALAKVVAGSDVLIVEGAGGVHVPVDERYAVLDIIRWLGLPTVCVSRPALGTINHTTLTVEALRAVRVEVAGVVINRFDAAHADVAARTNVSEIERYACVPVRCVVPESYFDGYHVPDAIRSEIDRVDWGRLAGVGKCRVSSAECRM